MRGLVADFKGGENDNAHDKAEPGQIDTREERDKTTDTSRNQHSRRNLPIPYGL